MLYNATFSTYRKVRVGVALEYDATATITSAPCFFQLADSRLKAILGLPNAVEVFQIVTDEQDFVRNDKVTIDGEDYFVEGIEFLGYNGIGQTRLIVNQEEN